MSLQTLLKTKTLSYTNGNPNTCSFTKFSSPTIKKNSISYKSSDFSTFSSQWKTKTSINSKIYERSINGLGISSFKNFYSKTNTNENLNFNSQNNIQILNYKNSFLDFVLNFSGKPKGWEHFPGQDGTNSDKNTKTPEESKSDKEDKGENKQDPKKKDDDENPLPFGTREVVIFIVLGLGLAAVITDVTYPSLTWQEFQNEYLANKKVKVIKVNSTKDFATVTMSDEMVKSFNKTLYIGSAKNLERKLEDYRKEIGVTPEVFLNEYAKVQYAPQESMWTEFGGFLLTVTIMGGIFFLLTRASMAASGGKGGMRGLFSIGKSNAKLFQKQDKIGTKFADVAGLPEAKMEVREFVDFLKSPKKYQELGAKIPKGALLVGPPGTGKTLLAKAAAGEASVPFFSTSGSDFIEMFVGVGPARVRDLFQQARENAPCIVFIDEIDAIGRERGKGGFRGGNDERENTLNQILVEMDGFASTTGVVILAATNRPDILDKALTRPGRFDRQIALDKPDVKSRKEIFEVHLKPLLLNKDSKLEDVAKQLANLTPGFSGADISNVCNEAALVAARRNGVDIVHADFENAIDRIIGGVEKKTKVLSPEEKKTVAFHEAGHAVTGWFLEHADPVIKVSVVPRGQGLGYSQHLPKDQYLVRREALIDMMCTALGGRVAEELFFNTLTTGAQDDLSKITKIAYSQITKYGMSKRIGTVSFPTESYQQRQYSDSTAEEIDEEVREMIEEAHQRTLNLMKEKKDLVEKVAIQLLEKEILRAEDLEKILGERPWKQTDLSHVYADEADKEKQIIEGKKEDVVFPSPVPPKEDQPLPPSTTQPGSFAPGDITTPQPPKL